MPRVERVLLLGYFGAGNFGDDALLADWLSRHAAEIDRRGVRADVLYNGQDPLAGFVEHGRLKPLLGRLIPKQEALKLDPRGYCALLAPGGSLLQDASSLKSLLYYLLVIRRFTRAGVPVLLQNQGLGPLTSLTARLATPYVLRSTRCLSLRDEQSYAWARSQRALARHQALHLSCDPVLSGSLQPYPESSALAGLPAGYFLVLPRVTGDLPYPGDPTTEPEALAKLIDAARRSSGLTPLLLPLHYKHDYPFCQATAAESSGVQVLDPSADRHSFSAIWQAISGAQLVISYRLHGLVCAAAHGIPALGVAYDPKVSAFCDELGYPYCFPATVHETDALRDIERLWRERDAVRQEAAERRAQLLERLAGCEAQAGELW